MEYGLFPIWSGWLSQGFSSKHNGIDIGYWTKDGAELPCRAYKSGTVVQSSENDGAGATYVVLKHINDDGSCQFSAYWHLVKGSEIKLGTIVKQGDFVGTRDSTGISSGPHLHFMLTTNLSNRDYSWNTLMANVINPIPYLHYIDGDHIECDGVTKMPDPVNVPQPVARDTTKHQVEVLIDNLRVRDASNNYYCTCKKGIFNVLSQANKTINGTIYLCDEIESGKWIATSGDWTKDLPIEDKDAIIKKLTKELAEANNKIVELNKTITDKDKVILDLTDTNESLSAKISNAQKALA